MTDPTKPAQLQPLLQRHGFRFQKSLGQNFLIVRWVAPRMAAAALTDRQTGVLELGPGAGALTVHLARAAGHVTALELDAGLLPVLAETLAPFDNTTVRQGDLLKTDLAALCRDTLPQPRRIAMANLPYNITTPAIYALLDAGCFEKIIVMVQKEVTDRLTAPPCGDALTAFSMLVQLRAAVEPLFAVKAGCFTPKPRVDSAVVALTPLDPQPSRHCLDLVRAGFAQRRKTLANALTPMLGRGMAEEAVARAGLHPGIRAEQMSAAQWRALAGEGR